MDEEQKPTLADFAGAIVEIETAECPIRREQYRDNLGGLNIRESFVIQTKNQLMKRRLTEGPKRPNWFIRWLFGRD